MDQSSSAYEVAVADYHPAEAGLAVRSAVFTVARRTLGVQMRIECEYARLTEGLALVTDFLARFAGAMADLKVLVLKAPPGWDPERADANDPASLERLFRVWEAIREREIAFRGGLAETRQAPGARPGAEPGVPLSPALPPAAQ